MALYFVEIRIAAITEVPAYDNADPASQKLSALRRNTQFLTDLINRSLKQIPNAEFSPKTGRTAVAFGFRRSGTAGYDAQRGRLSQSCSDLPDSGDFNLLLVVKFANTSDLAPSKERYEAFMAEWGKEQADASTEYAQKNYPGMRTITGEYIMREITLK